MARVAAQQLSSERLIHPSERLTLPYPPCCIYLNPAAVVGDFRKLVTVSAFRTETVPEAVRQAGLTAESG